MFHVLTKRAKKSNERKQSNENLWLPTYMTGWLAGWRANTTKTKCIACVICVVVIFGFMVIAKKKDITCVRCSVFSVHGHNVIVLHCLWMMIINLDLSFYISGANVLFQFIFTFECKRMYNNN